MSAMPDLHAAGATVQIDPDGTLHIEAPDKATAARLAADLDLTNHLVVTAEGESTETWAGRADLDGIPVRVAVTVQTVTTGGAS